MEAFEVGYADRTKLIKSRAYSPASVWKPLPKLDNVERPISRLGVGLLWK